MASVTSNAADVRRALSGLSQSLNPRRPVPGTSRRFGDALTDRAAVAVRERTAVRQESPDGSPLPRLSPRYKRRKVAKGLDPRILVATGEMLHVAQVRGEVTVTRDAVVMEAGLDQETRLKVHFAETAFGTRPRRHYYELGRDGERACDTLANEVLDKAVREASF